MLSPEMMYTAVNRNEFHKLKPLYYEICILAVLSGMEIDKAKRLYDVDTNKVLRHLKQRKTEFIKAHGGKLPAFYEFMTEGKVTTKSGVSSVKTLLFACLIYEESGRLLSRMKDAENYQADDLLFYQYFPELKEDAYTEYLYGHKYVHVVLGKSNN